MDERHFERESNHSNQVRPTACPNCNGEMGHGVLRTPGRHDTRVFIQSKWGEKQYLPLDVWVCKTCGYVELHTLLSDEHRLE